MLWYAAIAATVIGFSVARRSRLRLRFLISYVLAWALLGSIAGPYFASAGPAYFATVTGQASPYAPLMAQLQQVSAAGHPLEALQLQHVLWVVHVHHLHFYGAGISAMPSLHVALIVLCALALFGVRRSLGALFGVLAVLTQIGSVYLGWHYALDGYAAAAGILLIWYGVGRCLRGRAEGTPPSAHRAGYRTPVGRAATDAWPS